MSELKYSGSGTPFIELVDVEGKTYGNIIFSRITSTEAGYKYVCFTHRYTNQVCSKKGKGPNAKSTFTEVVVNDSFTFNLKFKRDEEGKKGVPQGMMPRRLVEWLIALFADYSLDGILPHSAIPGIAGDIAELDIDAVLVTEVERVRKAKAKVRKQKKLDKIAAADQADREEKIMQECNMRDFKNGKVEVKPLKNTVNLSDIF